MKKVLTSAIFVIIALSVAAQDAAERNLKLSVRNEKGKVLQGAEVYAFLTRDPEMGTLDKNGNRYFRITDADTLNLVIAGKYYEMPLEGIDSVYIAMKNTRKVSKVNSRDETDWLIMEAGGRSSNYEKMDDADAYSDLESYVKARISGVQIVGGEVQIRGVNSFNLSSSALIVIDGVITDGFATANATLSPRDIESITVLKDASSTSIYGARGAGGVLLIETKKAKVRQ